MRVIPAIADLRILAANVGIAAFLLLFMSNVSHSSPSPAVANHILRVEIKPVKQLTRINISFAREPIYTVSELPGDRLRVRFANTDGPIFKGKRSYSDGNIGGLVFSRQGGEMLLTFALAPQKVGYRVLHMAGISVLSIDVGQTIAQRRLPQALPGRERIRSGAEKLLMDFDPPLKPEIPFVPTDRQVLRTMLGEEDQKLFMEAEGSLYKGRLSAAEEAFSQFAARQTQIRPLALYRLAETQYRLQKYGQSLATFREATQLWDDFFAFNPTAMFYYGDSIARSGDLPGGRQMLAKLIVANSDKKFAPVLAVRMADVLARQGNDASAWAIYRTVAREFQDNKANQIARLKLADREFLQATPDTYERLAAVYKNLAENATDFDLREEASFKHALLEAINGPPASALDMVAKYQKRFPRGLFIPITNDMREDLVLLNYRAGSWDKNAPGLLRLVHDNQDYLGQAVSSPGFLQALSAAFEKAGRPLDMISLYAGILERPWASADNQAYLTMQIADQAELLGDSLMARRTLESFLRRYPMHEGAFEAKEKLAAIQYASKELAAVRSNLVWALGKDAKVKFPVSYYYLGRSMWDGKDYGRSAMAMETYLAVIKGSKDLPPLAGDAYYIAALSRQALKEANQALLHLQEGMKIVPKERRDQFLYKLGELSLQENSLAQAKEYFEQLADSGHDADWKRLARIALLDKKLSSLPPSKKP